ncbi:MAG: helix-turn-helix domain-containing protein [Evtepia sp.]
MFVKLAFRYSNSDKVVILMREKKEINIQIGKQVKLAREKSRLTQEQLAEQLECTPQYLSDLERGVVGISVALLKRLCSCAGGIQ